MAMELNKEQLIRIAKQFGTPVYVYHVERIKEQYDKLLTAFNGVDIKFFYAAKALTNINVLKYILSIGCNIDCSSVNEVKLALKAGFQPQNILYTSNNIAFEEIEEAKNIGVHINIDSISNLKKFGKKFGHSYPAGIRLRPNIMAGGNLKISTGHANSKFGVPLENIKEVLGRDDFNGTACIGAPLDLTVIDKYKEAGYSTISFNTEVWRKEYFNVYCPGKVTECGGYDNWLNAIRYAIKVFGEGNVRSNFVAGLQPKEILLEGIEALASIGVVAVASSWVPALGSPLEGHRSPTVDWHWDVQLKVAQILRKYGRTYEQIFNATAGRGITLDIYEVEDETWHSFEKEKLAIS